MKNNRTFLEKLLDGAEVEWKTVKSLCNDNFWLMPATPEFDDNGTIPYITSKNIKGGKSISKIQNISMSMFIKNYLELGAL